MIYGRLADALVVFHAVYVAVVVLGEAAILLGWPLRWQWIRNLPFRAVHVLMIVIVALQAVVGVICPLTTLEDWLRRQAGQTVEQGTFIGRCVHDLLFIDAPTWAFTLCYCLFGALVLATWLLVPPRRLRRDATAT